MKEPLELAEARERRSLALERRVRVAVESLAAEGIAVSFYRVAERAQVARSTLYRNEALRACVEGARAYQADEAARAAASAIDEALLQNASLRTEVEELRRALAAVENQRDCLLAHGQMRHAPSDKASYVYAVCVLREAA